MRQARTSVAQWGAAAAVADAAGASGAPPETDAPAADAQAGDEGADVAASAPAGGVIRVGYAPIVRVDAPRREIELCATSEAIDSYGTVFDYAASKDAFTRWIGNVREMHARRAVGRRVAVRCDDDARKIYVRLRVSKGAEDTWEKIADGTLRGASIGASNVTWERGYKTPHNAANNRAVPSEAAPKTNCIVTQAVPRTWRKALLRAS
jgi:hypothetical protein